MNSRFALWLLLAWGAGCPAIAHDFWVQPNEFQVRPFTAVPFTLQVGHGDSHERSQISRRRLVRVEAISPNGTVIDLRNHLRPAGALEDGRLSVGSRGTYMIIVETDNEAQSYLPASRFNEYIDAEGLTPALTERMRNARMHVDGLERYGRRAKAILQVGERDAQRQSQVTKPVGLSLEIVPEVNPYSEPRPATLPVQVIYEGWPLAGASVRLVDVDHRKLVECRITDGSGHARFTMPEVGRWLVKVVWTKPVASSADADFETVFSSLTFAIPP